MCLIALQPCAESGAPITDVACVLPLGSILVTLMSEWNTERDLPRVARLRTTNPWVPHAMVSNHETPQGFQALLELIRPGLRGGVTWVTPAGGNLVTEVRLAIVRRRPPTSEELVEYVSARTLQTDTHFLILALAGTNSRNLRRNLSQAGFPPPSHWHALLEFMPMLVAAAATGSSLDASAELVHLSPKTVSRRCRVLFGCSWAELLSIRVWEAWTERFLRSHRR